MKIYKVEVLNNSFSETIKEKDLDSHLANHIERFLNKNHERGWDFVGLESLTVDVKTSLFSKRKQINKNIAVFKKSQIHQNEQTTPNKEKETVTSISIGPAKKR